MAQRMSLLTWGFLVLSGLGVVLLIIGSPGIDVAVPVGALVLFVVLINRGIVKLWEALRPERTPYP
jgi:FtsH-binding integral membrane protein